MIEEHSKAGVLERVASGVPGLDVILGGGFFRSGVYMILGSPGTGKTILGNQICFGHVGTGGRAVYLTLLTESHARLISHQSSLDFFDKESIGASLYYVSGYEALEKDKLKGLLEIVRNVLRQHKATFLVLDGLVTAGAMAQSEVELKKFIHELQVLVELVGCTVVLLTGSNTDVDQYSMRTMVDGLVRLSLEPAGMGAVRTIEIMKSRGGAHFLGRHFFEISRAGIAVHPRTEALLGQAWSQPESRQVPLAFGVESLDEMIGGGLQPGSVTMLLGTPGSGKTLLGLRFLDEGAREKEPGLYFGFFETPAQIVRKAHAIGGTFERHHKTGLIEVLWRPPLELIADALAEEVLAAVKRRKVRRLFIDGFGGFKDSLVYADRTARFLSALSNELRGLGVGVILSDETSYLVGPEVEAPLGGLTAILDNVIFLRHVEMRARLHRLISVMKLREGAGDSSLREFSISKGGIDVSSTFESAEAVLTGIARMTDSVVPAPPAPPRRKGRAKTRR